jgi:hypothetical protein
MSVNTASAHPTPAPRVHTQLLPSFASSFPEHSNPHAMAMKPSTSEPALPPIQTLSPQRDGPSRSPGAERPVRPRESAMSRKRVRQDGEEEDRPGSV